MDFELSDDQVLLLDTAREFFTRSYPLERMRERFLLADQPGRALWDDVCALGWNAAPFPEAVGGVAGSLLDASLLAIEMGRNACFTPYPHSTLASGLALCAEGSSLAGAIAASQAVVIPVPAALQPTPLDGPPDKLRGQAVAVPAADVATHLLVEHGDRAVLVPLAEGTVDCEVLPTSRGETLCRLTFREARGEALADRALFRGVQDYGAVGCAALLLGLAERALELAVAHACERVQFGRPIGSFQALQHKAADMRIALEVGRALVLRAAAAESEAALFSHAASRAKAWLADAARKVTRDALQIFGGLGYCDDHAVQLMHRGVVSLANHYGAAHAHRERLARELLG